MLLRSASTPLLNSWALNNTTSGASISTNSSPEPNKSNISLTPSCCSKSRLIRASSESDLRHLCAVSPKVNPFGSCHGLGFGSASRLLTNSGLGLRERVVGNEEEECDVEERESMGLSCDGSGGIGGGFDGGNGFGFGFGSWDSNNENGGESTDLYYQKMIEANPGNSLLLGNYAKFLKEVNLFIYFYVLHMIRIGI